MKDWIRISLHFVDYRNGKKRMVVFLCLTEWICLIGICFRFEWECDVSDLQRVLMRISGDLEE